MRTKRVGVSRARMIAAWSACVVATAAGRASAQGFTGLGDLPGGFFLSDARAVSPDGRVVVGLGYSAIGLQAFRWESGVMHGLTPLPTNSFPYSVGVCASADGSVVVGTAQSMSGNEAFRAVGMTPMVGLGDLPGNGLLSDAFGVNADGSVIVGRGSSLNGFEAFRWVKGVGMTALGDLPGGAFSSQATAVTPDGRVVVGRGRSEAGNEAFRWIAELGMVSLGDLSDGDVGSEAAAVSADGTVVVGTGEGESGSEAFRWTEGAGMAGLGTLPGFLHRSFALAVSADGAVIVGFSGDPDGERTAFYWTRERGMRPLDRVLIDDYGLDLTGWTLVAARGISADGRVIVGVGINPSGDTEAWLAQLPPPPCDADYNGDGGADILDLLSFFEDLGFCLNLPAPCGILFDPDINGDTIVDILDFLDFMQATSEGC